MTESFNFKDLTLIYLYLFQHGPPHLANMIASGPPPSVVSSQQQCPVSQSFSQPVVTVTQTTQGYEDFR